MVGFVVALSMVLIPPADGVSSMLDQPVPVTSREDDGGALVTGVFDFGCRFECAREAFAAYRDCIEDGGDRETCFEELRETYRACIAECEVSCEEQCFIDGRDVFRTCREEGGSRRECWMQTREFVMGCIEGCDGGAPWPASELSLDPPPIGTGGSGGNSYSNDSCLLECVIEAAGAYRDCRDDGGDREECRQVFADVFGACAAECELTCEEQCFLDSGRQLQECIEDGGDRFECLMGAFQSLRACLEECDG